MTEAQLFEAIRDLAKFRGWMFMHIHDSRRSAGDGWPDLFLLHPRTGQIVVAELKSATGRVTVAQQAWLDAFRAAGIEAHVWRPADLPGEIARALTPSDVARTYAGRS